MRYRLYRLTVPCDDPLDGDLVGVYDDFDAALDARDDDAVALLAAERGRAMLACHTIVGPGRHGSDTAHPVTSSLGSDTATTDLDGMVADTRSWLRHLRQRGEPAAL